MSRCWVIYIYIYIYIYILSDSWHTEYSNPTDVTWAQLICLSAWVTMGPVITVSLGGLEVPTSRTRFVKKNN